MSLRSKLELLQELKTFLKERKKIWLFPLFLLIIVIGALLVFAQSSALAPLIYTIF